MLREALERSADELFVGRERELRQLTAALEDAIGGRGRIVLVAGEPGIGKTRLAENVADAAAARGAKIIWGRCWEGEGAPAFWPWIQVTRAYMRGCNAATLAERLGLGAPYLTQVVPEIRDVVPNLAAAPPLDSEQALFRLYDSFAAFFCNAAAREPLVLVLDDLHWADKSSLLLLQFLARELRDARLLVIGTYRDVEVSVGHPLGDVLPRLRRERTVDRVLLRGLPESDVRNFLEAMRGEQVPEEFAENLAHETAGNPFFIKEILRHLVDEGVAAEEDGRWVGRRSIDEIHLPESVREVIGRRLARLGEPCRRLLTIASVVGREFTIDTVGQALELPRHNALESLDEARAVRLVEEAPTPGRFRFSHALIRETLYAELGTAERIRLHRRIGEAIERQHARDPQPYLAALAHHFFEAMSGGDAAKAADYSERAGDRAAEQLAYAEAARLYGRALEALDLADPDNDKRRCELLIKAGEAQWSGGGFENPIEVFTEAALLAERLNEPELLARAAISFAGPGIGVVVISAVKREAELLKRALAALDPKDSPLRARALARLAGRRHIFEEAASLGRPAIEMARRIGDTPTLAYVLNAVVWATCGPDNLEEHIELTEEMIGLAEEIGDAKLRAEGYHWRSVLRMQMGDIESADRDVEVQLRYAETSREPYARWRAALNRGARALLHGRMEEAERHLREATSVALELWGTAVDPVPVTLDLGLGPAIRRERNHLTERDIAAYEELETHQAGIWRVAVAGAYLRAGRVAEARRYFEVLAENRFGKVPRDLMWPYSMVQLGEMAALLDDAARAEQLYDLLLPYADRCVIVGAVVCRGSVARTLGILASMLSRFDEAERHFEAALAMNEKIRGTLWIAHTQHDYARMLCRRNGPGDRDTATGLLDAALATARACGMTILAEVIASTLAETGLRARAEEPAAGVVAPPSEASFRKDGDFWTLTYEGSSLRLKDSKGLQYVAELLFHEAEEIHALDLAGAGSTPSAVRDRGDAGEILDAQARSEYRERLAGLEAELQEATRWSDVGRAARLREEIDFLKDELSAAFGVGGRARKAGDVTERARKAVASRIRDTIERIRKEHRPLALHLENAIRTGAFCSYQPDRSPGWKL